MAGRCWRRGGVSRRRQHERRQPRAAMIVVSGDREELRAVTIEQREHYLPKPGRRLRRVKLRLAAWGVHPIASRWQVK